jgi:molybdopterin molybdotransferase
VISVEDHLGRCLSAVAVVPPRACPLLEALDCVLAEDVVAELDLPGFANSAMDGYAVHLADIAGAGERHPVSLPVVADVPAGPSEPLTLAEGTAVRVMPGAPIPDGTGAVVPVEWTDAGTETVQVRKAPGPGQFLRRPGEDVTLGELLLRSGTRLSPRHIGLLAAVGRDRVLVHPHPRVVILSTGSELVPPGRPLGHGQIHDSNGYALVAAATELGAQARYEGFVGDAEDEVAAALERAADGADLVITSGGVSAGAYDPVKAVLSRSGTVWFGTVAMQPGMPQGFGSYGPARIPILTLPGNPVSSMVSFEVFARPLLRTLAGEGTLHRHRVPAVAEVGWDSPQGKRQFVRAVLQRHRDRVASVRPVGAQGSHLVADLAEATCLAVVPEAVTRVEPGEELECLLLDRGRR